MLSHHRGHHCQHRSDDFPIIAEILGRFQPTTVVELGTDEGGFTSFLAEVVRKWGGHVTTFDIERKFESGLLDQQDISFELCDVLIQPAQEVIRLIAQPKSLLYCDNGNKKREVELYAEYLLPGSVLGVHDYDTEIMADWVEPFVAELGFEPSGHDLMETLRNEWYAPMTRFWVRQ